MGNFKSPDFPKPYPPNIDCLLYTFVGRPDQIVEITFLDFDVRKTNLRYLTMIEQTQYFNKIKCVFSFVKRKQDLPNT